MLVVQVLEKCFARNPEDRPRSTDLLKEPFFHEEDDDDDDSVTTGGDEEQPIGLGGAQRLRTKSKFNENGYAELPAFDVKVAAQRADLKSRDMKMKGSPTHVDLPLNDFVKIEPAARPATGMGGKVVSPPNYVKRPATTVPSTVGVEGGEEVPQEWPSWAKQEVEVQRKSGEGLGWAGGGEEEEERLPPPTDFGRSPESVYATPRGGGRKERRESEDNDLVFMSADMYGDAETGANPFGNAAIKKEREKVGGGAGRGPKQGKESPTNLKRGPSVTQFQQDLDSPRGLSKKNQQWDSVRGKVNTPKGGEVSPHTHTPTHTHASGPTLREEGQREKKRASESTSTSPPTLTQSSQSQYRESRLESAATPTASNITQSQQNALAKAAEEEEEEPTEWVCAFCQTPNDMSLEYCNNCAKWRKVMNGSLHRGGHDARSVITTSNAWGKTIKGGNMTDSKDYQNMGAVRHETNRTKLQKAQSTGNAGNRMHMNASNPNSGGSKSSRQSERKRYT